MPIYAYRCGECGHSQDVLQKISDPQLTICPVCIQTSFSKQVTAAGFALKCTGWYTTYFKEHSASKPVTQQVNVTDTSAPVYADSCPTQ